jgi:hypothetical protein
MSHKRKRAPATAPASEEKSKFDKIDDSKDTAPSQRPSSGYAQAVISNRHAAFAHLTEKISCVGRQYFVGSLGDAALVMLRNDTVSGDDSKWTLFMWTPRTKRGQVGTAEISSADGGDSGGAA